MNLLWMSIAASPVIVWFIRRMNDGSDEPYGLLALAFALAVIRRDRHQLQPTAWSRILGAALILVSVLSIGNLPPLLRAVLVVTGTATWFGAHRMPGVTGLMVLSLPVISSLEFYAAWPLRLAAAEGTVRLLELAGLVIQRTGVNLSIGGVSVAVDPACSGVRMMWFAVVAAMALAAFHRVPWRDALLGAAAAIAWVIPANILRASWLTLEESGRFDGSWLGHGGVGLLSFALVLIPLSLWLEKRGRLPEVSIGHPRSTPLRDASGRRHELAANLLLVLAAALTPFMLLHKPSPAVVRTNLPPPSEFTFNGITLPLMPIEPTPTEQAFAKSFPGSLQSHQWGAGQVVMRTSLKATRRLHPSRDCLRAAGFQTTDAVTVRTTDGAEWSRFHASRDGIRLRVHERIVSEQTGESWTDVTAWYWAALRHPLNGPWRAETVILD